MSTDLTPTALRRLAVPDGRHHLEADLTLPEGATGLVLLAHVPGAGAGRNRHAPATDLLHEAGIATLHFPLLTDAEALIRANSFDLELLADRLAAATNAVARLPECAPLPLGYLGDGTGAGAALVAAARLGRRVRAVVARGGRPDLAGPWLHQVKAATLLVVGGLDTPVLGLNHLALEQLEGAKRLTVVPGASHLFEEPGTLEQAMRLARDWFQHHLHLPAAVH